MMKFQDFSRFPNLPIHKYQTAPIYLEPMQGSGERITVAGIAIGQHEMLIEKLVSAETATYIYGKQGEKLISLCDMIISDLHIHLTNGELSSWKSSIAGAELGYIQTARADNARHALTQIAHLHASLCRLPALMALEDDDQEQNNNNDNSMSAWVKQVQNFAIAKNPDFSSYFNVKEILSQGDSITLHFAKASLAINIGLLMPNRMNIKVNDAKIKLWNLEHLPEHYDKKRLILGVPRNDSPEMADERVRSKVLGKIDALQNEAEKSNIELKTSYSAEEAANLLAA